MPAHLHNRNCTAANASKLHALNEQRGKSDSATVAMTATLWVDSRLRIRSLSTYRGQS